MNDLSLNDMAFVLDADMNANVSIETHIKYAKLLILRKKNHRGTYLKFMQNLKTIFLKLESKRLNSNKIKTKRLNMIFPFQIFSFCRNIK
jgi:hypothetical protein